MIKMSFISSKAIAIVVLMCATLFCATVVTFSLTTSIVPRTPEHEALHYIRSQHVKKIIIDVDAGVDDALAILLALAKNRSEYPEVIAITCSHGNTNLTNVVINVLRTLKLLKLKIPVYPGAVTSLLITPSGDNFYGKDGFGDVPDSSPTSLEEAEREHAAIALTRLANQHTGELGIISLGPLTNLALAQRLDPDFKRNVKQIWWMGGSVEGIGNIKPGIEFNAFMDPDANYIVFNSIGPPIILLSWETCIYHGSTSQQWRLDVLGKISSPIIRFLNAIEKVSLQKSTKWAPCDAKTISVLLDPTIATKAVKHNVQPIFQGDARGALMVDYKDGTGKLHNAIIVTEIDARKFNLMCIDNLSI